MICLSDHRYSLLQDGGNLTIDFDVPTDIREFEFRMHNMGEIACKITRLTIRERETGPAEE